MLGNIDVYLHKYLRRLLRFAEKRLEDTKISLRKVGITTFFLLRKFASSQNLIYHVPFHSFKSAVNVVSPEVSPAKFPLAVPAEYDASEIMIVLRAFHKDLCDKIGGD